jgi:hypothetical protein
MFFLFYLTSRRSIVIKLSNGRLEAVIENWPVGRNKRATATFKVETAVKGAKKGQQRVVRQIGTAKPKDSGYYLRTVIVDGDDDRTYVAAYTEYGQAVLIPGTLAKGVDQDYWEIVAQVFSEEEVANLRKALEARGEDIAGGLYTPAKGEANAEA